MVENKKHYDRQAEQVDSVDQKVHSLVTQISNVMSSTLSSVMNVMGELEREAPDLMHLLDTIDDEKGLRLEAIQSDESGTMYMRALDSLTNIGLAEMHIEAGTTPSATYLVFELTDLGVFAKSAHLTFRGKRNGFALLARGTANVDRQGKP